MAAKRPAIALLMLAFTLHSGVNFVAPRAAREQQGAQILSATVGIPVALAFPAVSLAADIKKVTGPRPNALDNIFFDEPRSLGALGVPWLSWNLVYVSLALFALGALVVFPVLAGVFLAPAETMQEVRSKPGYVRREFRQPGLANPALDKAPEDAEKGLPKRGPNDFSPAALTN
eukprot:CAMPEP_0172672982 /NCGR_PEP_ID=MMETSP1074-20121228/11874_1 /TAXON_ID=2916 /ORGANISM="Ceratium fusus, Strain PA161109" /LENGTH=173 /DNA_ID=CAMNT_0013490237 /DNA_START=74 /DNA_END=595 /DNA_ORIENTATION=+